MAFWKKSEDPWDIDPNKRRPTQTFYVNEETETEEGPGLVDVVKQWGEKLNAAASKETLLPPETCPRCGKEMLQGYIVATKQIWWVPGAPSIRKKWIGPKREDCLLVDDEGAIFTYKTTWHCPACQWMYINAEGMEPPMSMAESELDLDESGEKEDT